VPPPDSAQVAAAQAPAPAAPEAAVGPAPAAGSEFKLDVARPPQPATHKNAKNIALTGASVTCRERKRYSSGGFYWAVLHGIDAAARAVTTTFTRK